MGVFHSNVGRHRDESLSATFSCSWEECFKAVVRSADVETLQVPDEQMINATMINQPAKEAEKKTVTMRNFVIFF